MVTFLAPEAMGEFQWSRTGLTGLTRKCSDVGVWIIQGVRASWFGILCFLRLLLKVKSTPIIPLLVTCWA